MNIHKYLQALKQKHLNHSLKKLYDRLRSKGGGTYINIHIQFMELIKQMIHIFQDTSKPCFHLNQNYLRLEDRFRRDFQILSYAKV